MCLPQQVKATLYLKHRQALGEHTNLNAKIELHARTALDGGKLSEVEKRVDGRVELSQKLLNLTGPLILLPLKTKWLLTCNCCWLQTARTAGCVWALTCVRKACTPKPGRITCRSSLRGTGLALFLTRSCTTSKCCARGGQDAWLCYWGHRKRKDAGSARVGMLKSTQKFAT